ncbi:MAG: hypothetical protein ACOCRZ_06300 [Halothermotrichaceae bacterium]
MASKLKIKIKINRLYIPLPAVPLSLAAWFIKFAAKHSTNEEKDIDIKLQPEEINQLVDTLKSTEPFELADIDVEDKGKRIRIKIYTR